MKRFLLRGLLYAIPLFIAVATIYIIDPYFLFSGKEKYDKAKFDIGYSFDQGRRYKIFTYWNEPTDKIILGASEINLITEHNIPEGGWHSMSYGGAPLQESLRMYWEVSKKHRLSKVIIAPEFIKYFNAISSGNGDPYYANFSWNTSQSKKAFDIYNNKLDYFIDKYTLKSTWEYLSSLFFNVGVKSVPRLTKEAFWKSQMDYAHEIYDGNTIFTEKISEIMDLFRTIKNDADKNKTEILIVIPVQHVDLLKTEFQPRVYHVYKEYIKSLAEIFGEVYYFAYTSGNSEDDTMFSDPFHYLSPDLYLDNIFNGDESSFILTPNTVENKLDSIKKILYPNE